MGGRPPRHGGPADAPVLPRTVPPPSRVPPPPVPPGRRPAVHRRPVRRPGCPGLGGGRGRLVRPHLLPARHPVGVPRPGPQSPPLLPGGRRPAERPPARAGATGVLGPDRGLLP